MSARKKKDYLLYMMNIATTSNDMHSLLRHQARVTNVSGAEHGGGHLAQVSTLQALVASQPVNVTYY
jgi:hypothetical protein